jgi:hypothetical protein
MSAFEGGGAAVDADSHRDTPCCNTGVLFSRRVVVLARLDDEEGTTTTLVADCWSSVGLESCAGGSSSDATQNGTLMVVLRKSMVVVSSIL